MIPNQADANDFTGSFTLPNGLTTATGQWASFQYNGKARFGLLHAIRPAASGGFNLVYFVGEKGDTVPPENPKDFKSFHESRIEQFNPA